MKKLVLIAALSLGLAGCHDVLLGTPQNNLNKARLACRDGVEYLQSNNAYGDSFTPHLQRNGVPYSCN